MRAATPDNVVVHADLAGLRVAALDLSLDGTHHVDGPAVVYAIDGPVTAEFADDRVTLQPGDALAAVGVHLTGSAHALICTGPAAADAVALAETGTARADTTNHYSWGDGCAGWKLVEHPALSVRQERMPPGTAESTHTHARARQVFFALSGRPTLALPDGERQLTPGASVTVPPGVPHQMRNHGPDDAAFLAISAPATADDRADADVALVAAPGDHALPATTALLLIDVQQAFLDPAWGVRNNLDAEANIARLLAAFRDAGRTVIHVHHRNAEPGRRFHPDSPGHAPKPEAAPLPGEPVLTKTVNSAFIGTDLEDRLRLEGITDLVICGITTDHCVSTTTRMAANLGFRVRLVADASATFDRTGPDGRHWTAQQMHDTTVASLHDEFASIVTTDDITAANWPPTSSRVGGCGEVKSADLQPGIEIKPVGVGARRA